MKNITARFLIVSSLILLTTCSQRSQVLEVGGVEIGNPPSSLRTVIGSVPSTTMSALMTTQASLGNEIPCTADRIIATDMNGHRTTAAIQINCSFAIDLSITYAYSLYFSKNEVEIAQIKFKNSENNTLIIHEGEGEINLGLITFSPTAEGLEAVPENDPSLSDNQKTTEANTANDPSLANNPLSASTPPDYAVWNGQYSGGSYNGGACLNVPVGFTIQVSQAGGNHILTVTQSYSLGGNPDVFAAGNSTRVYTGVMIPGENPIEVSLSMAGTVTTCQIDAPLLNISRFEMDCLINDPTLPAADIFCHYQDYSKIE